MEPMPHKVMVGGHNVKATECMHYTTSESTTRRGPIIFSQDIHINFLKIGPEKCSLHCFFFFFLIWVATKVIGCRMIAKFCYLVTGTMQGSWQALSALSHCRKCV